MIAASETGVSTKTGVSDELVLMDQRWFQEERIWNIDHLAVAQLFVQDGNRRLGTQRHDQVPGTSYWSPHRWDAGSQDTTSVESFQQCHKIRQEQSLGGRLPLPPSFAPKKVETLPQRAEVLLTAAQKRTIGKYLLDVFGGYGFLAQTTNHLGLRGYVLDTKFRPRYDMAKPFVLTRIGQDVSAGKCVAGMISPPRRPAMANVLHRARMPWILGHPCDSWLWDVPKIQTLTAQPRTAWALTVLVNRKRTLFLVGNVDRRDFLALLANVLVQVEVAAFQDKNMVFQSVPIHAQTLSLHVTTPALTVYLLRLP